MLFDRLMRPTWRLPKSVPSGYKLYLSQRQFGRLKWVFKYIKRRFFCFVVGRICGLVTECPEIESKHRVILWINWAAPSLGDSLMDLSARVLLKDREIILLTHPNNYLLYLDDFVFSAVFSDAREVVAHYGRAAFDLVIVDSYSPRVLYNKLIVAPTTPFAPLYGYLNGFEVHRTYFAFARMMELLALNNIDEPMRPFISLEGGSQHQTPEVDVCIAIGGEWSFRTYRDWCPFVSWLVARGWSVSLVGSENGARHASEILATEPSVNSTVGTLSLAEVIAEIVKAKVFVGADGGLWHIACAIPIPSVVLFADCQIFNEDGYRMTRETKDIICEVLYDDVQVSNIHVDSVIEAFKTLVARIEVHASGL